MMGKINNAVKTVKDIADGAGRLGEWWSRVRLRKKREYQRADEDILNAVQKLYKKHKIEDVYKAVDATCLAYDTERKQPKIDPEPIIYNEMGARLLETPANSICRDIDAFTEQRARRAFNSEYPNDPTNIFCDFLMKYTWDLNVTLEAGNNSESLKKTQQKCKVMVALLNDLILNDTFTNEPKNTDSIYNTFQNIVVQYRTMLSMVEKKMLTLTAKDHFETLYLQCHSTIDLITQTLMYLPSDVPLPKNFSVIKANNQNIVDRKLSEALNDTRIGELMQVLLNTKEMSYLFPKDVDGRRQDVAVLDKLEDVYQNSNNNNQQVAAYKPKIRNVFVNDAHLLNPSYVAFLRGDDKTSQVKGDNKTLQELSDSDSIAKTYLTRIGGGAYKNFGIHQDLRHLISEEIVRIYMLTNDLALCSIGVKLFLEKLIAAFGDFGAYVFGARLNELLLSSVDDVSQKLTKSFDNVQTIINREYMEIKKRTHYLPNWSNNFSYHQALFDSSILHLNELIEKTKTIQTDLYRLTTEQRVQDFRRGMQLLQGMFGDLVLRVLPNSSHMGLAYLGLSSHLNNLGGGLSLNPQALITAGSSAERVELRIEELPSIPAGSTQIVLSEDEIQSRLVELLADASATLKQFMKDYQHDVKLASTCVMAFYPLNKKPIVEDSNIPIHERRLVGRIEDIIGKVSTLGSDSTKMEIVNSELRRWQATIKKELKFDNLQL